MQGGASVAPASVSIRSNEVTELQKQIFDLQKRICDSRKARRAKEISQPESEKTSKAAARPIEVSACLSFL